MSMNTNASVSITTSSVFPQTKICLAIRQTLEQMIPNIKLQLLEQELKGGAQMVISLEAETPIDTNTNENKSVGIRGTFTVPNDLDYIVKAQWEGAVNVLRELNDILNCKRLRWEESIGYEPRDFQNNSEELLNKGLKIITNAELHELGISSKKYKFGFDIKTVRNNNTTLTELKIEGFAHMR